MIGEGRSSQREAAGAEGAAPKSVHGASDCSKLRCWTRTTAVAGKGGGRDQDAHKVRTKMSFSFN